MYPSFNNNGSKPQMCSSLLSNYYNDNIPSISHEHYHTPSSSSSFLLPYPIYNPLEDDAVFCEFFQQHILSNDHNLNILAHGMTNNVESSMGECNNNNVQVATDDDHRYYSTHVKPDNDGSPSKRPSNRDRHRKINTARGLRDRRMRLSLDVAKKFFGLQDLLGFDKASKTIDWLLTQSKTAILNLLPANRASSTSECEVGSATKAKSCYGGSKKQKDKFTKETRVRARQRARERTMEKHKHAVGQDSSFRPGLDQVMDQDVNQLGFWSSFHESQCELNQMSSNFQCNQGVVGDSSSFLMTANCTPSYLFD